MPHEDTSAASKIRLFAGALVALALSVSPVAAAAETASAAAVIDKVTPEMVSDALRKYGLSFEPQRDRAGDPLLIVRPGPLIHDQGMAVIFYGCEEGDACDTFSLYTFFKTDRPLEDETYHIWNDIFRVRTWTKAFRDSDGDTGLVLNVNAVGGVGLPSLDFLVSVFLTEINAFRDAVRGVAGSERARISGTGPWVSAFTEALDTVKEPALDKNPKAAEKASVKTFMGQ